MTSFGSYRTACPNDHAGGYLRKKALGAQGFSYILTSSPTPPRQSSTRRKVRMLKVLWSVPKTSVEWVSDRQEPQAAGPEA
jgi:hypothetical protein